MKINPLNQAYMPNFSKRIIDTAHVRKVDGGVKTVDFVEFERDNPDDVSKIDDLNESWGKDDRAPYIKDIYLKMHFLNTGDLVFPSQIVALEDSNGEILSIASIKPYTLFSGKNIMSLGSAEITYLQGNPYEQNKSTERKYKGCGEALTAQIVKLAQQKDADGLAICSENDGFWDHSGLFEEQRKSVDSEAITHTHYLKRNDFDAFRNYVLAKTALDKGNDDHKNVKKGRSADKSNRDKSPAKP